MNTKFLAVISVIALATICVVQGQSPSPAESPAASPSPAEKAASPSPAESPAASPKEKATPKKAKPTPTARPAARPSPAARAIDEAANPPAPGGGHGQVWVNPETGLPQDRLAFLRHDAEGQIHDRAGRNPGWIQAGAHETIGRQGLGKQALRSGHISRRRLAPIERERPQRFVRRVGGITFRGKHVINSFLLLDRSSVRH